MLRSRDPAVSRIRGVSEWISEDVTLAFLGNLAARGFHIQSGVPKASDWKERPEVGDTLNQS